MFIFRFDPKLPYDRDSQESWQRLKYDIAQFCEAREKQEERESKKAADDLEAARLVSRFMLWTVWSPTLIWVSISCMYFIGAALGTGWQIYGSLGEYGYHTLLFNGQSVLGYILMKSSFVLFFRILKRGIEQREAKAQESLSGDTLYRRAKTTLSAMDLWEKQAACFAEVAELEALEGIRVEVDRSGGEAARERIGRAARGLQCRIRLHEKGVRTDETFNGLEEMSLELGERLVRIGGYLEEDGDLLTRAMYASEVSDALVSTLEEVDRDPLADQIDEAYDRSENAPPEASPAELSVVVPFKKRG